MKAYKFRPAAQLEFIFDILIKNRLYCANWKELNDPMEGMFIFNPWKFTGKGAALSVRGIKTAKIKRRICSLSGEVENYLLWAHYADGFNGVAIEVELPDGSSNIKDVEPRSDYYYESLDEYLSDSEAADAILLSKHETWSYENEIRILYTPVKEGYNFYDVEIPIKIIYVGSRMSAVLVDALNIICEKLDIQMFKVKIGSQGFAISRVQDVKKTLKIKNK